MNPPGLDGAPAAPTTSEVSAEQLKQEKKQCQQNLTNIFAAIQAYRLDRKQLPNKFGDLLPRYLANPNVLKCPSCLRMGTTSERIMRSTDEPELISTYTYEFRPTPIPANISGGSERTMQEWKQLQMTLVGSDVSLVRCHCHANSINLTFGGVIYDGSEGWEAMQARVVPQTELAFTTLFARYAVVQVIQIPERDVTCPASMLDLTHHYNGSLTKHWYGRDATRTLGLLPRGRQRLDGVEFDVRGLIQLRGADNRFDVVHYPARVTNLVVGMRSQALHFLHGSNGDQTTNQVGRYVIRYADRSEVEVPLRYGEHLLHWRADATGLKRWRAPAHTRVAWEGSDPAWGAKGKVGRLYHTRWPNPRPEVVIGSIDFLSDLRGSAPFLVAITVERAP